jgi:hypothetical protein
LAPDFDDGIAVAVVALRADALVLSDVVVVWNVSVRVVSKLGKIIASCRFTRSNGKSPFEAGIQLNIF